MVTRESGFIKRILTFAFLLITVSFLTQCGTEENGVIFEDQGRRTPMFSADSAYHFVEQQVGFGPRNPNSEGHVQAMGYLSEKIRSYAGRENVFVQSFQVDVYNETLELHNIIAAFNPTSRDRILLAAHWDTRPRADEDDINTDQPIPGADDGASGVAVLLELARIMKENPPPVGVDIILFDGEDVGNSGDLDNFFQGSRYWGENPPVSGYMPRIAILLDMVGARDAKFPKESYSMRFAPEVVNALWNIAASLGYEDYFINETGSYISDDHVIVQRLTSIPMIDIIHHNSQSRGRNIFPDYWHSHDDNLSIIDENTLQAVGDLVTELIYNRIP